MKFLNVTFSNGETYRIPRDQIADHRATGYHDRGTSDWDTVFATTMNLDAVAIDWARRKMTWADLENFALPINEPAEVDYDEEWPACKVMCSDAD